MDRRQTLASTFFVGFFVIPGVDRFAEELDTPLTRRALKSE
jgi:hypothetical protein